MKIEYKKSLEDLRTRHKVMSEMIDEGYSFREVAEEFGISKQRVHQIVKMYRERCAKRGVSGDRFADDENMKLFLGIS